MEKADVVVIGGGATGAATTRDLAMRGLKVVMIDRGDICSGTTGHLQGGASLGGRYVVSDPLLAKEHNQETPIMSKLAPHSFKYIGEFYVVTEPDDLEYKDLLLKEAKKLGIPMKEVKPTEALMKEPKLNPKIIAAVEHPFWRMDPFSLILSMCLSASTHGADIRTYTEAIDILEDGKTITGVKVVDHITEKTYTIRCDIVVDAAGPWGGTIANMAGADLPLRPTAGVNVVLGRRLVDMTISHCRHPGDGDLVQPHHTTTVLGTTAWAVADPDKVSVPRDHVDLIIRETAKLVPLIKETRVIRAYAGVRPLVKPPPGTPEREITRSSKSMELKSGLVAIVGGNVATSRLMGERASDLICKLLGVRAKCETDKDPLPEAKSVTLARLSEKYKLFCILAGRSIERFGYVTEHIFGLTTEKPLHRQIVCKCECVSRAEIEYAVSRLWAHFLNDIRRRTRIGMGLCQGLYCSPKVAGILVEEFNRPVQEVHKDLMNFLWMRWQGQKHAGWGHQLRQQAMMEAVYGCVGNYDKLKQLHPRNYGPKFSKSGYVS